MTKSLLSIWHLLSKRQIDGEDFVIFLWPSYLENMKFKEKKKKLLKNCQWQFMFIISFFYWFSSNQSELIRKIRENNLFLFSWKQIHVALSS